MGRASMWLYEYSERDKRLVEGMRESLLPCAEAMSPLKPGSTVKQLGGSCSQQFLLAMVGKNRAYAHRGERGVLS